MKKKFNFNIKNYIGEIFTIIIIGILTSYLFVNVGFREHIDSEFWIISGVSFATMIAMTGIWYPIGKQREALKNDVYKKQKLEYSLLVDKVMKTNNFSGLKQFCDYATEQNKLEAIRIKLAKINVDMSLYEKYKKDISLVDKDKNLDETQKKKLKKIIRYGLSYKFLWWRFTGYDRINHNAVTSGVDRLKGEYDVKNEEKAFDRKVTIAKILTSMIGTIFMAFIIFSGKGFDIGKLAQILTWLGLIAWNIFTTLNNSAKSISVYRTNYYKKLRSFLEEFCTTKYFDKSVEWTRPVVKGDSLNEQESL